MKIISILLLSCLSVSAQVVYSPFAGSGQFQPMPTTINNGGGSTTNFNLLNVTNTATIGLLSSDSGAFTSDGGGNVTITKGLTVGSGGGLTSLDGGAINTDGSGGLTASTFSGTYTGTIAASAITSGTVALARSTTNFVSITVTNGVKTQNTNQYAIAASGWTNTNSFNCVAYVVPTAATITYSDGTNTIGTYTSVTSVGPIPFVMHPSYKVTAASGLAGKAVAQ